MRLDNRLGDQVLENGTVVEGYTARIGDVADGNYFEIEEDGSVLLHGDATEWTDWQGALISNQLVNPSAHITRNDAEASLTYKTNCDLGDYAYMSPQMPHGWLLGSAIHPHIHWWQTSVKVPNWLVQYRWQRNGQAKTTTWTNHPLTVNAYTWSAGTLCQITAGATSIIPPVGYSLSDIIQFRVLRDVTNTSEAFSGAESLPIDTQAVSFDFHYEIDALGSRAEYVK